jgi:catechol 2,3-dioxygenase-like lactoylglutathione lyase family enzyme
VNFISIRLITNNVDGLVKFYEQITGLALIRSTEDFAELKTPSCTLAIASTRTIELLGAGAAHAADNHTMIIEFRVDDVDQEYEKLKNLVTEFVKEPATMPWGNRSMLFRDPDGNLINFFTPVSPDTIKKLDQ